MSLAIALEAAVQHLRQLKQERKALDGFLALGNESGRAYALDKEIGKLQDAISSCAKEAGVWVEYLGETCMDGGTCHHECEDRCFRRECCVPLTQAMEGGLTLAQWRYPEAAPQEVQAAVPEAIEQMAVDRYKVVPSHESMFHRWAVVAGNGTHQLYIGREVECQNMARKFIGAFLDGAFVAIQNAAPAHPAEGVPAQCPNINEPRGCWRVACQLGGKCREPERSATQPAAHGMEALTIVEKLPRYTYGYKSDEWGMNRCLRAYQDNAGTFLMRDEVLAALAAQAKQGDEQ